MNHRLRKALRIFVMSSGLFSLAHQAGAATSIVAVPTNWRLENYTNSNSVTIWYAGAVCGQGRLTLPSQSTADMKNRLWALILSAKTTQSAVVVFYNETDPDCTILSFATSP